MPVGLCLVFYFIGTSTNLLRFSGGSTAESTTEAMEDTEDTADETTTEGTTEAKKYVTLPSFIGMTRTRAESQAEELNLTAKFEYEDGVDEESDSLIVVAQGTDEGRDVLEGSTITLTLGTDEEENTQVEVPPLVNYEEEEAISELESLGLKAEVVYANSDTVEVRVMALHISMSRSMVARAVMSSRVSRGVMRSIRASVS